MNLYRLLRTAKAAAGEVTALVVAAENPDQARLQAVLNAGTEKVTDWADDAWSTVTLLGSTADSFDEAHGPGAVVVAVQA